MRTRSIGIWPILTVLALAGPSQARGRLGVHAARLEAGFLRPGNSSVREVDDSVWAVGAEYNRPLMDHLDSVWSMAYSTLDGSSDTVTMDIQVLAVSGGVNFYLGSSERFNPYVGVQTGYVWSETTANLPRYQDGRYSKGGTVGVEIGAEIEVARSTTVRPSLAYDWIEDGDDVIAGVELSHWFGVLPLCTAFVGYGFDQGDLMATIGLGIRL